MVEGKTVFEDVEVLSVRGELPGEVTQLTCDSREVKPGGVFVALRGTEYDGHCFIPDVYHHHAACAVVEEILDLDFNQIQVKDTLASLPKLAANFYGHPAKELHLTGITGSNGKTTTTYLLENMLHAAGKDCGVLGTIEYRYGKQVFSAPNTTPLPHELQHHLRNIADAGIHHAAMEVSSHGLALHRVDVVSFDTAVFTNLSQDHLDFHHTMQEYRDAKRLLFTHHLKPDGKAVINIDDETGREFAGEIAKDQLITFAVEQKADIYASRIHTHISGNTFTVHLQDQAFQTHTSLIGKHNIYNVLGVCGAALAVGMSVEEIEQGIQHFCPVPGRLESIHNTIRAQVVVDYCHTEDALEKCLETLSAIPHQRMITLFGCGGDRDPFKRPMMAKAAAAFSDVMIVTSDNPRTENPDEIIKHITAGLRNTTKQYEVIPDRREAILAAAEMLQEGDILLLAGKGHEDYQIIGREKHPFDDRVVARECLQQTGKG